MWQISRGRIDRLVVFVFIGDTYAPAGLLTFEGSGRARKSRFAYARSYIERPDRLALDPIGLGAFGKSVGSTPDEVPLAFYDAGPDGWGKQLLISAYPGLELGMGEFLALGTASRTGNLAFGPTPHAPATWSPDDRPLIQLPTGEDHLEDLIKAAEAYEDGHARKHHIDLLMAGHAYDVGGARPKARVTYDGSEWIAKFPSLGDHFNEPLIAALCLDIAEAAGLPVPERRIIKAGHKDVLLVRRFDRDKAGKPCGYLSAGTIMKQPFTEYATRTTYYDIARRARELGAHDPERAMLLRFMVNAHIHNTDDHLRNHALLAGDGRWDLSPVFDIVPTRPQRHVCGPYPGASPEWNVPQAYQAYKGFGCKKDVADELSEQIRQALRHLPHLMDARGIGKKLISQVKTALGGQPWPAGMP